MAINLGIKKGSPSVDIGVSKSNPTVPMQIKFAPISIVLSVKKG